MTVGLILSRTLTPVNHLAMMAAPYSHSSVEIKKVYIFLHLNIACKSYSSRIAYVSIVFIRIYRVLLLRLKTVIN